MNSQRGWKSLRAASYIFGPIITYMVAISPGDGSSQVTLNRASKPFGSAFNASRSAIPALASRSIAGERVSVCSSIFTLITGAPSQIDGLPFLSMRLGLGQSTSIHPASSSASSMYPRRVINSRCEKFTPPTYFIPAYGLSLSAIRFIASSPSWRGVQYIASAKLASSAFRFASAARSFDSATFWSEMVCKSDRALLALLPKTISQAIATASKTSLRISAAVSCHFFGSAYHQRTIASKTSAATTARAHQVSKHEFISTARRSSTSLLSLFGFVFLGHRRFHTPSRQERIVIRSFWVIIFILILALAILKYIYHVAPAP
jgi:hypothetical protein